MGIKDFWPLVGDGETRNVAEWATLHYQAHGRPLRVAIDQASWWYNVMKDDEEARIKRDYPGSHPREKRVLERVKDLLLKNVNVIFVFDGAQKDKPASTCQVIHPNVIRVLRRTLSVIGVPQHDAPGDAEAECARLQELGIVDAVWSDDSDTFMFGCSTVVRFKREAPTTKSPKGEKSSDKVLVYELAKVTELTGLDRNGIIFFALLTGNDFDRHVGLHGCGKELAIQLARQDDLTARLAAVVAEKDLSKWRAHLALAIKRIRPNFVFTNFASFGSFSILQNCRYPKVSSDLVLASSTLPQGGWSQSLRASPPSAQQMTDNYRFLLEHYYSTKPRNWPAKLLVPLSLVHELRRELCTEEELRDRFGLSLKSKRKDKTTTTVKIEDPVSVLPGLCHGFDIPEVSAFLQFESIDFDLPDCVLRRGFSNTGLTSGRTGPGCAGPTIAKITPKTSLRQPADKSANSSKWKSVALGIEPKSRKALRITQPRAPSIRLAGKGKVITSSEPDADPIPTQSSCTRYASTEKVHTNRLDHTKDTTFGTGANPIEIDSD